MKCHTVDCADPATVRVFWPGELVVMCRPCALRAVKEAKEPTP